jgi:hypothetical protein
MKVVFLFFFIIVASSCSQHESSACLDKLKSPRLDFIADTIADIRAKSTITEDDYKYINQLQNEENAIWRSAESGC